MCRELKCKPDTLNAYLIKMGIKPGIKMGQILNELFEMVVEEKIKNEYDVLRNYVDEVYLN